MITVAAGVEEDLLFLVFFWVENVVAASKHTYDNVTMRVVF